MSWRQASRRDVQEILDLLLPDESLCVSFSSRLRSQARGVSVYVRVDAAGRIRDCLLHSTYGLVLPVLPSADVEEEDLARLIADLRPSVHSTMGIGEWVRRVEDLLPVPPTTRVEYHLMAVERSGFQRPGSPHVDALVRKASVADAASLFPLQKSYEIEEVVLSPSHFSDAQCMKLLRQSLEEELIFIAEASGTPVAKAGTNARGYGVDQIGGVFTVARERGKGLASLVMSELLTVIFEEKRAACLFVKKNNATAISLYKHLGFKTRDEYVINYYGL